MKQFKTILISALITLLAFGAITYTSCTKDPCSGVNCLNGGACSGGTCSCPSGFTGEYCGETFVTYQNDTYTPISITANGSNATIPIGGTITFHGLVGNALNVTAATSGTTSSGTVIGTLIAWNNLSATFPGSGTTIIAIDVSSDYFFLNVQNTNSTNSINSISVNYNNSAATTDNVEVPNDGNIYGIGYYLAYTNTGIKLTGSLGGYETFFPYTTASSFTTNQSYTADFTN